MSSGLQTDENRGHFLHVSFSQPFEKLIARDQKNLTHLLIATKQHLLYLQQEPHPSFWRLRQ